MLKIKVGTKEFEYLNSLETEEYYNGSSRRTLTVNCSSDAIGLDELNVLLTEDNLAGLVMTNTEGISVYKDVLAENEEGEMVPTGEQEFDHFDPIVNYFDGYVLKLSCGITSVITQPETPDTPAVYEEQIVFKIGKRTYIEEQLHKLGL